MKANYDTYGTTDFNGFQGFDFNEAGFDFSDFSDFSNFGSIFETFFGERRGRRRERRGADLKTNITINIHEVYSGVEKKISVRKPVICPDCNGSGAESLSDIITCPDCNGSGYIKRSQRTPFGIFSTTTTCHTCQGSGKYIKNTCRKCRGKGVVTEDKNITVKIPAGIESGSTLRIAGEGEAVKDGRPGDLYVVVYVEEDEVFKRDGQDIIVEAQISFFQAVLGDEIEVPTLGGKAKLTIPRGTQPGTMFRMKSQGLPFVNSPRRGDQFVRVNVVIPEKLTKRQEEMIRELSKEFGKANYQKGFFKRIF